MVTYIRDEIIKRTNKRKAWFPFSNSSDRMSRESSVYALASLEKSSLFCGHALAQHQVTPLGLNLSTTVQPFKTPYYT